MKKSTERIATESPLQILQRCEKEIASAISDLINQEVCISDPDERFCHCSGVVSDVAIGSAIYVKVRFNRQQAISFMPSQLAMKILSVH